MVSTGGFNLHFTTSSSLVNIPEPAGKRLRARVQRASWIDYYVIFELQLAVRLELYWLKPSHNYYFTR